MNTYFHWTTRTRFSHPHFHSEKNAEWMWQYLQKEFPQMIAGCLMPNHLHIVSKAESSDSLMKHGKKTLATATQALRLGSHAFELPPNPVSIPDRKHLLRTVRYVYLNPCRDQLVTDPLSWPYSTYRLALGFGPHPNHASTHFLRSAGFSADRFHQYVSSDPSVKVAGTPLPKIKKPCGEPTQGIQVYRDAVASFLRVRSGPVFRKHLLALLQDQGLMHTPFLEQTVGISRSQVCRLRKCLPLHTHTMQVLRAFAEDERLRG